MSDLPMVNLKISRIIPCSFIKHVVIHLYLIQNVLVDDHPGAGHHPKQERKLQKKPQNV